MAVVSMENVRALYTTTTTTAAACRVCLVFHSLLPFPPALLVTEIHLTTELFTKGKRYTRITIDLGMVSCFTSDYHQRLWSLTFINQSDIV